MNASNHFDKKEKTEWENKIIAIKDDFDEAKLYFKGLVRDYEVYVQNSNGTADAGDELWKYIAGIA